METTLGLWLTFSGQQGGTIHDAVRDFRALPSKRQDAFCGNLTNHLSNLSDPQNASLFMKARLESSGIVIRTAGARCRAMIGSGNKKLNPRQLLLLSLVDQQTEWDSGNLPRNRPGEQVTCYFYPHSPMFSTRLGVHVSIYGPGDSAAFKALERRGLIKPYKFGKMGPYTYTVTEDGMSALAQQENELTLDNPAYKALRPLPVED